MIEHIEMWLAIVGLWVTQVKILYDLKELKSVVKIEKFAHLNQR